MKRIVGQLMISMEINTVSLYKYLGYYHSPEAFARGEGLCEHRREVVVYWHQAWETT
jgi:hypothetical protein